MKVCLEKYMYANFELDLVDTLDERCECHSYCLRKQNPRLRVKEFQTMVDFAEQSSLATVDLPPQYTYALVIPSKIARSTRLLQSIIRRKACDTQ